MMDLAFLQASQTALDLFGAVIFSVTGALVASRKQMDVLGFLWLGTATGVGGGTLRDLILGQPVFWVENNAPLAACLIAAFVVHFTAPFVQSRYRLILWLDALGMAMAAVAGAAKALEVGTGALIAVVMGVFSASVGGIIRDLLGQEPSIVIKRDIYVVAAAVGATTYVALIHLGFGGLAAATCGFSAGALLRLAAILRNWSMPIFRPREGLDYPPS